MEKLVVYLIISNISCQNVQYSISNCKLRKCIFIVKATYKFHTIFKPIFVSEPGGTRIPVDSGNDLVLNG